MLLWFTLIISMAITIVFFNFFGISDPDYLPVILLIILALGCIFMTIQMLAGDFGMRSSGRIMTISNVEERARKMEEMGVEKMLKKTKAVVLEISKRGNALYVIDQLVPNYEFKYLVYEDPSTKGKIYGCFVPSDITKADQAMAWKFQITEEEYEKDLIYEA